jgi:type IV fimbrial biogenesis protein FimT
MSRTSSSRHLAGPSKRRANRGYNLIETITVMTLIAILAAIAVPSYRYVTSANRIASEGNGLLGDLQFARAEAIKEGQPVTVCMSKGGATCDTTGNAWQSGWIVYSNPTGTGSNTTIPAAGSILRIQSTFTSTDTFLAAPAFSSITYNREGFAIGVGNGTLITLQTVPEVTSYTRCLSIGLVGLTAIQPYDGVTCQ